MTTTRPTVHFREPQDSSFRGDLLVAGEKIEYSSLRCEGCSAEPNWESMGLSVGLAGVFLLLAVVAVKTLLVK